MFRWKTLKQFFTRASAQTVRPLSEDASALIERQRYLAEFILLAQTRAVKPIREVDRKVS